MKKIHSVLPGIDGIVDNPEANPGDEEEYQAWLERQVNGEPKPWFFPPDDRPF